MNKLAVMMSFRPKWCQKILLGEKLIEIRKTIPKLPTPFTVYMYQCKYDNNKPDSGMVVGQFVVDWIADCKDIPGKCFHELSGMSTQQWLKYTENHKGPVYALHISDLEVYNTPKSISVFRKKCIYPDPALCLWCSHYNNITCLNYWHKAPQSWGYVNDDYSFES